jgi:hypothetical protein
VARSRIDWDDVAADVRAAIESQTGPVLKAETAAEGRNSEIAAFVHTATGRVFVKGLRTDQRGAQTQQMEAMINPYVAPIAPRLLWQIHTGPWHMLGFDYIDGRHADFSPGSPDLPKVIHAMRKLADIPCPDLPLKRAEQRWAPYTDDPSAPDLLRGDSLLHTDYNPLNILIGDTAHIIDWAWPTRGAAWIDPACLVLRLMATGHSPSEAEAWAQQVPSWSTGSQRAINTFAAANAALWAEIVKDDPQPWKRRIAAVARQWLQYRQSVCRTATGRSFPD